MPRGNFPWYLQRFEPVHCGRALCVHCTCTVRCTVKTHTHTHTHVPSWGWKHTGLCRSQEWQKKKTDGDCERHMSPSMSMNWLCPTEAVKNPEKDFYIEISYNKYVGSYIHTNIRTYIRTYSQTCEHAASAQLGQKTRRQDFCRRYPQKVCIYPTSKRFQKGHTYVHTCKHTYTHTYIHTYIQTKYIHTDRHTDMHASRHANMHACICGKPNACVLTVHAQCTPQCTPQCTRRKWCK